MLQLFGWLGFLLLGILATATTAVLAAAVVSIVLAVTSNDER